MDEKYLKMIETLAARLGVTADHLWGVLIKQALITGVTDLIVALALVSLTATASGQAHRGGWDWESAPPFVVLLLGFVTLFYIMANAEEIVTAFANPEYWAMYQLIHH